MKYNANTVYHKFYDTKSRGGEAERDCGGEGAKAAADIVRGKAKTKYQKTLGAFEKAPKPAKLLAGCFASLGRGVFYFSVHEGTGQNSQGRKDRGDF